LLKKNDDLNRGIFQLVTKIGIYGGQASVINYYEKISTVYLLIPRILIETKILS